MKKIEIEIPDDSILVQEGDKYIIKKKDSKPRTWKDFCKNYPITSEEYYIDTDCSIYNCNNCLRKEEEDKNVYTSVEEAEAFLALAQLRRLRKEWIGNWEQPIGKSIGVILYYLLEDKVKADSGTYTINKNLSFPTPEMAKEFFNCFKDLCETAKILL